MPQTRKIAPELKVIELLIARLRQHSRLPSQDTSVLYGFHPRTALLAPGQDIVRQGDRPNKAIMVLSGMLARYQTLPNGNRQFLSLHIAADFPDLQSLFLGRMDHALCAIDRAEIAMFAHAELRASFGRSQALVMALWRQTLIDAAIFRQAITNNGSRSPPGRVAHVFCEQLARAREAGLNEGHSCSFPLNQTQIGQLLGMSLPTANRAIQRLRDYARLRSSRLEVTDWKSLTKVAGFDPDYLHLGSAEL